MAIGATNLTTTTSTKFIPEVWSADIIRATESNLVFADKVKRYDRDVRGKGDVVHIPNLSNLTAYQKSANTEITPEAVTENEKTITVDQHWYSSVLIEDITAVQSDYDLMKEYTQKAGYTIAKKVDSSIAGLYSGLSQTVGNSSTNITDANLITAIQYLDDADAPEMDRFFVINPAGKSDLMGIDKFVLRTGPGWSPSDSPILNGPKSAGYFGDLYGIKVYISTNVAVEAGSPNTVHGMLFQKEAFGLAMQQSPRVQTQYKAEHLADLLVVDVLYGVAELRDTFAVDYKYAV